MSSYDGDKSVGNGRIQEKTLVDVIMSVGWTVNQKRATEWKRTIEVALAIWVAMADVAKVAH